MFITYSPYCVSDSMSKFHIWSTQQSSTIKSFEQKGCYNCSVSYLYSLHYFYGGAALEKIDSVHLYEYVNTTSNMLYLLII